MGVESDLDKSVTLGDADGPDVFIPELGREVPTFVDDREDLIPAHAKGKFKRLNHHVPFVMRGNFKPEDWPESYRKQAGQVRVDVAGHVLCSGVNKQGVICSSRAVNRSRFCRSHGGSLHPADKKISGSTMVGESGMPMDRIKKLDRVQLFMQGIITPDQLEDDEVKGRFVRDNNGVPVKTVKLGAKFEAILHKELLRRMNEYLQTKAPRALEVMYEVADSDLYEAADRIKAAQWLAERVIGKTPDVLVNLDATETPFSTILAHIDHTSRADYRKSIEAGSGGGEASDDRGILDVEVFVEDTEYDDVLGEDDEEGDSTLNGNFWVGEGLRSESDLRNDEDEDTESGSDDSSGEDENSATFDRIIQSREDRKLAIKEARERIKKAKGKRYAARATGADSLAGIPILVQFKEIKGSDNFRVKLVPGSSASPAQIDRLIG